LAGITAASSSLQLPTKSRDNDRARAHWILWFQSLG
jgi:hypothetical protein